jgi:hypothetical protein
MHLWLAKLIVVVHAAVVFVLIFGGATLIAGRFSRLHFVWRLLFMVSFAGFIASEIVYHDCVLTVFEKQLWSRYGTGPAYERSFIDHYFPLLGRIIAHQGGIIIVAGIVFRVIYIWWNEVAKAQNSV